MKPSILVVALLVSGCAPHFAYVPAPPATPTQVYGRDAALYSIPQGSPHGELRVIAYGVEELAPGDPDDAASADAPGFSALHLRVIITNTGQSPWTFDTREQQIALPGRGVSSVAFASADREGDASQPPLIQIFFGNTRIVDEFFPLPPDVQKSEMLPAFQAMTKVHTDAPDATLETTTFTNTDVGVWAVYAEDEQTGTDIYDVDQYNYEYWDDPFWFNAGFVGFAGVPHAWGGRIYSRGWNRTTGFGHNKHWQSGGGNGKGGHGNNSRRRNNNNGGGGHGGGHGGHK